jgi:RsiW-degrading membrane proteinase PrsW (M82 family)
LNFEKLKRDVKILIEPVFLGTFIPILFLTIAIKGEHKNLLLFFMWGMIAFLLSYLINTQLNNVLKMSVISLETSAAPIVEEFLKAVPLTVFLFVKKGKVYPIVVLAMVSGIGFSIQENYMYLFDMKNHDVSAVVAMVIRSITTCLMHGMSTAIVGYGISFLRNYKAMVIPFTFSMYSIAVIVHSIFNLFVGSKFHVIGLVIPIILYIFALMITYTSKGEESATANI